MASTIKIYTRSLNDWHYSRWLDTARRLPWPKFPLKGTSALGYLQHILAADADWVINMDEDCFPLHKEVLADLIDDMERSGAAYAGIPDGGAIDVRNHNPLAMNPFFNVFHVYRIRNELPVKVVGMEQLKARVPPHLLSEYHFDGFEPYYPVFFWLLDRFSPCYLDARTWTDGLSTLLSWNSREICLHTWYLRQYWSDQCTRDRIDAARHFVIHREGLREQPLEWD